MTQLSTADFITQTIICTRPLPEKDICSRCGETMEQGEIAHLLQPSGGNCHTRCNL